jgi:hypothetical protein
VQGLSLSSPGGDTSMDGSQLTLVWFLVRMEPGFWFWPVIPTILLWSSQATWCSVVRDSESPQAEGPCGQVTQSPCDVWRS